MRPPRGTFVAILAAACLLSAWPAGAATVKITKYYESGFVLWNRRTRANPTCDAPVSSCKWTRDRTVELGGVRFDPAGGSGAPLTMTIQVKDDYNPYGKVSISYCADTSEDSACGSRDTVWKNTCVKPTDKVVLRNVARKYAVIVTVQVAYSCTQFVNDLPDDQGVATSGSITLTYVK